MKPQQRQSDSTVITIASIAMERMETVIATRMSITIIAETAVTIRTASAGGTSQQQ